jgi:hypothetical protein
MRRVIVSLGLVGALVVLPATAALAAAGGTARPLDGVGKGRLTLTDAQAGTFIIRGKANITHLGLVKVRGTGSFTGPTTYAFTAKLVAANGDKVKTSSTGEVVDGKFTNHDTVTGGTGRFVGATGQSTTTGTLKPKKTDPNVLRLKFTLTGTISY